MCEYCNGVNGCEWTGGKMADVESLDAEDWRRIYEFMVNVQLPFLHRIIINARRRNNRSIKTGKPIRRSKA